MKIRIVTTLFIAALVAGLAGAQTQTRQYSAKFICGKASDEQVKAFLAAPGLYYTAINVHNLTSNTTAGLRKRWSFGKVNEQPGGLSPWVSASVPPGQTILIDCRELLGAVGNPPFAEGAIEIISTADIDVIGVYTSVGASNLVTTMTIDRAPRR